MNGGFDSATLLLFAGLLLMTMVLMRRLRRRGRSAAAPRASSPTPNIAELAHASRLADDYEVRLHNSFREINGRLDTKINVLNELIIEAESKTRELRQAITDLAHSSQQTDEPLIVGMSIESPPASTPRVPNEEVHALADRGASAAQISRDLNMPIGEINLILGLRRRKSG